MVTATTPAVSPRSNAKIVFFAVFFALTVLLVYHKDARVFDPQSPIARHYAPAKWYLVVHGLFGAVTMAVAAFQFSNRLRARYLPVHRVLGYVYVASVFISAPLTIGRRDPLEVYGPKGLKAMTEHLQEAYRVDIETRTNADGNQRDRPDGHNVDVHEIGVGIIYKDANVTVTAFPTKHAMESYGYRFDTPDRTIVISGDTNPAQATIDACNGCDVLIHEAHPPGWIATRPPTFQRFAAKYHTTTAQLADLARQAKPRLLVIYHYPNAPEDVFADMSKRYKEEFVVGRDLDIY